MVESEYLKNKGECEMNEKDARKILQDASIITDKAVDDVVGACCEYSVGGLLVAFRETGFTLGTWEINSIIWAYLNWVIANQRYT